MASALTQDRSEGAALRSSELSVPQIEHVVNGKRFAGEGTRKLNVFNPATGDVVGWVKAATPGDVDAAVQAARAACTAASTSPGVAAFTQPTTSPVAGLNTFSFRVPSPAKRFPFTTCSIWGTDSSELRRAAPSLLS